MNQSKDNLNEEWRKVFDKASETPPPDIWDSIERHLDEQNRVPLAMPWWRKTQSWLTAASVLLVLGVGTALFLLNRVADTGSGSDKAVTSAANTAAEKGAAEKGIAGKETVRKKVSDASEGEAIAASKPAIQGSREEGETRTGNRYQARHKVGNSYSEQATGLLAKRDMKLSKGGSQSSSRDGQPTKNDLFSGREAEETLVALDYIEPSAPREIDTYWQTRYVFFNPYATKMKEEQPAKPEPGPLWAGLNMMPGGFNPNMQFSHESVYQMNHAFNTANMAEYHGMANASNRAVTDNRDQPKISFQAGAQVGFKLSERWSLESGVAFLRGNSTSRSPGFFMDRATSESADLLPNAMVSGKSSYSDETVQKLRLNSSAESTSAVYIPMDKNMSNTYSYLQVPAYVGYTLRPEKKLSYTLLGGGITNFFLKNNLETASGYTLETKRENNVYNDLSVSAAAGMRLNYRLNDAWNTSLTANYQYSLMNSFKENRFLTSRPQVYGVSWGVRYTFQK